MFAYKKMMFAFISVSFIFMASCSSGNVSTVLSASSEGEVVESPLASLSEGDRLTIKYSLKIEAAEGGTIPAGMADVINGEYAKGFEIKILAREMPRHYFTHWTSSSGGVFTDAKNSSTIFTMPGNDTVITAHFAESSSK